MADKDGFSGFPSKATRFFQDLEDDNSREFWTANKDTFESAVKEPMAALLDSLPDRYHPFKVFRMNRDVRFSADKSPYKLMHGASSTAANSLWYVHLDGRGLLAAVGAYLMSPDQLDRYRQAVADDTSGPRLEKIIAKLERTGIEVGHGGPEPLKTAPRGYPKDHPRVALLRQKGLIAWRTLTGTQLRDGEAVRGFVVDTFTAGKPLNDWIAGNVGTGDEPRR